MMNPDREGEHVSLWIDDHNSEEDGGHDKTRKEIPKNSDNDHQTKFHRRWNQIFLILCEFALFLDPLYCYIPSIEDDTCFSLDLKLWIIFFSSRSIIDMFYAVDLYVFLRQVILRKPKGKNKKTGLIEWQGCKSYMVMLPYKQLLIIPYKLLLIIHRIFVSIPIPQAIIIDGKFASIGVSVPLLLFYPTQYALRAYGTYKLMKQNRPDIVTEIGRWLQAILDFLPFIVSAHLFGAVWYYFALDREIYCWREACSKIGVKCHVPNNGLFSRRCLIDSSNGTFYYYDNTGINLSMLCAPSPQGDITFDFGIYLHAIQSKVTRSKTFPRKVLQCFWWGLRHLSSFGSNLETSPDMMENILAILVSISGMALFLVYLNARVQGSKKRLDELQLSRKMQKINPEIDLWVSKKGLPKDMKMVIKREVRQKLKENRDVDMQNLLVGLPMHMTEQKKIMHQLRLASVKKVPRLKEMNERVLQAICNHLEPVTYPKNSYIIHVGEQLSNMLFITQGTVLTYTIGTGTRVGSSTSGSASAECHLKKGDFYGEELMNWAFCFGSFSDLPISTRTVMCRTKVEAFSLSANDLESIISQFMIYFSRKLELHPQDHFQLENVAASCIQAAWRCHRHCTIKKAKASTSWNVLLQKTHQTLGINHCQMGKISVD